MAAMYEIMGPIVLLDAYTGEITMSSEFAYRGRGDEPNGDDGNLWSRRPPLSEKQEFNDHLMAGEMFVDWTPFEHPQFGPVEIGGWKPFDVRSTPGWMLPETLHRNAMFVVWTAMQLPRVTVEVVAHEDLGDGLWRVRARAANLAGLPRRGGTVTLYTAEGPREFPVAGIYYDYVTGGGTVSSSTSNRAWRSAVGVSGSSVAIPSRATV